jgi:glycosyltransferase involved in cell wall biosynthesis
MTQRILYVQYTNPAAYPPLEHSSRVLARAGWEVLFLGIAKHGDPYLSWPPRRGIGILDLPPSGPGWIRKLHYARFAVWVLSWVVRWRPMWVYASDALACPVVLPLTFWPGLNVLYHEHDAPQVSHQGLVRRLVLWARRKLAARAAVRVLPNEERAQQFNSAIANHQLTFSVWNCPSSDEVTPPRGPHPGGNLEVLYAGSIVPFRLPTSVIEALAQLPDEVRLRVVGYVTQGHSEYVRILRTAAVRLGVAHRIQFADGLPHEDLLVASRTADVGLVLMPVATNDGSRQWMPGASNKPFDYLASGLALLVSDQPGWRQLYVQPGYGRACDADDARSIAEALRWFLEHPAEMRSMGERGRQRVASEWNYERQFAGVRDRLNANHTLT